MWEKQTARVAAVKKVSATIPQPEPLETNGSVKSHDDLNIAERRRLDMQKQWAK